MGKLFCFLILLGLSFGSLYAEPVSDLKLDKTKKSKKIKKKKKKINKKKYAKKPYWKDMMNDPEVNYFEAKAAFEAYWRKGKEEYEHEHGSSSESKSRSELKAEQERQSLNIEYKQFRKWLMDNSPYVQSDGSILPIEEQRKIIENAR